MNDARWQLHVYSIHCSLLRALVVNSAACKRRYHARIDSLLDFELAQKRDRQRKRRQRSYNISPTVITRERDGKKREEKTIIRTRGQIDRITRLILGVLLLTDRES